MEAIVLAGGLGTRLRSLVSDRPKPLAPINGRPFLEILLEYWIGQGVQRVVLSVGYMHEAIASTLGSEYRGCALAYAVESKPLGTGGGLMLAAEQLRGDGPFLAVNGDTIFRVPLATLADFHHAHRAEMTLALFATTDTARYTGIATDKDGRVSALQGTDAANGGVYLVDKSVLAGLPWPRGSRFSLEEELLPHLLKMGRGLYGKRCTGTFLDIGVPEDYQRAQTLLSSAQP
jgi:D-glycero-alpha-D-manno-heptose 1-phosphate guanylyltransferase